VTLTFDFLTLAVSNELRAWHIQHTYQFLHPTVIHSWVMCDSIWSCYHHPERSLRMRSITWPVHRGSQNHSNNFLTPTYLFIMQLLWGYDDDWGQFILEHLHVKAIFGRKKTKSSQNRFQKWRFFRNLRVYILIVVIGTPKWHILGRNEVFWRIFRKKNPFRSVCCSELQEPKKSVNVTPDGTENHVYGEQYLIQTYYIVVLIL